MKKVANKSTKLKLSTQTVRTLNTDMLRGVVGGRIVFCEETDAACGTSSPHPQ